MMKKAGEAEARQLTVDEALLLVDALNGTFPHLPCEPLLTVDEHIRLDDADRRWGVEREHMYRTLRSLRPEMFAEILDPINRFWGAEMGVSHGEAIARSGLLDIDFPATPDPGFTETLPEPWRSKNRIDLAVAGKGGRRSEVAGFLESSDPDVRRYAFEALGENSLEDPADLDGDEG